MSAGGQAISWVSSGCDLQRARAWEATIAANSEIVLYERLATA
jgi:hypothetical protein